MPATTAIDFARLTALLVEAATKGSFTANKDNDFWNFDGKTFNRTGKLTSTQLEQNETTILNNAYSKLVKILSSNKHEQLSTKYGQGSISRIFGLASTLINYEWLNVLVDLESNPIPIKKDLGRKSDYMLDVLDRI